MAQGHCKHEFAEQLSCARSDVAEDKLLQPRIPTGPMPSSGGPLETSGRSSPLRRWVCFLTSENYFGSSKNSGSDIDHRAALAKRIIGGFEHLYHPHAGNAIIEGRSVISN